MLSNLHKLCFFLILFLQSDIKYIVINTFGDNPNLYYIRIADIIARFLAHMYNLIMIMIKIIPYMS
jgi:hypothetical protein